MNKRAKYNSVLLLTLALLIAFSYGCDNDTSSNAQPMLDSPIDTPPNLLTTTSRTRVDPSGEECAGLDGYEVGDPVVIEITLPIMGPEPVVSTEQAELCLSNLLTNESQTCMGDVNQDNNLVPSNITCDNIHVTISFSSEINQVKVTDLNTMECATMTIQEMTICLDENSPFGPLC